MDGASGVRAQEGDHVGQGGGGHPLAGVGVGHGSAVVGGVDDGGQHAVDVDALALEFGRHRFGHALQRALGGRVGAHQCRAALRAERAHRDDAPAAGALHVGHHLGGHGQQRTQVEVEQALQRLRGCGVHRVAHGKTAGQVAQHADVAQPRGCRRHRRRGAFAIKQVGPEADMLRRVCAVVATQGIRVAVEQRQAGALGGERGGHGAAQVAGGAGDQHGLGRQR